MYAGRKGLSMGDYDGISTGIIAIMVVAAIATPFAIWKLVELIIWLFQPVHIG